jgi:DNA transposition AAA+ family ATPase
MTNQPNSASSSFVATKEYRRFAEFCDACRRYRYIGLCYGPPGVGKTLSARHYSRWDELEQHIEQTIDKTISEEVLDRRSVFYTPMVDASLKKLWENISNLCNSFKRLTENAYANDHKAPLTFGFPPSETELFIIDEADRLKTQAIDLVRDCYDRHLFGSLILIGMPGIEKRLARYPQFYSRIGFVHQFRPLSPEEVRFLFEHQWQQLGIQLQPSDFSDAEALSAIIRITGGNFRLMQRLCTQIERILQINEQQLITKEVVEAARENLVIGQV